MADQKKTRGRKAASVRTPAESTPKKRRTAKAATAKTSEVKSVAVKNAENTPEIKAEAARPATAKAADVLLETVEAVKAAAVRAAQTAPASAPAQPAAEPAPALARASLSPVQAAVPALRLVEAGAEQVRTAYVRAQANTEQLRNAMTETAAASTRGLLEVNEKVLDAMRAQSDATLEIWRSTVTAGSFAEAIRAQTSGAREFYETATARWRDVAESTTRWFGTTLKPLQGTWTDRAR